MQRRIYARTHASTHALTQAHAHLHTLTHTHTHVNALTHTDVHMHVHMKTHTHTHTHTHTCAYTNDLRPLAAAVNDFKSISVAVISERRETKLSVGKLLEPTDGGSPDRWCEHSNNYLLCLRARAVCACVCVQRKPE